jgi:DNA-damage-inducible protein D
VHTDPLPFDHIPDPETPDNRTGTADLAVPLPDRAGTPFDAIRRRDGDGAEYWSARDLMPLLGYQSWQKFELAVDRATIAAKSTGADTSRHFTGTNKVIKGGRWGEQTVSDVHLSRYGCYLVAMNGDPRKPQIAAAQTYFAVRTHEAETATAASGPQLTRLELIHLACQAELERLAAEQRAITAEAANAELIPKAQAHDAYLAAPNNGRLVREVAQLLGYTERALRQFLIDQRMIYPRYAPCTTTQYDAYASLAHHFKPVETVVNHQWGPCSHFTLYVLPSGTELIRRRAHRTHPGTCTGPGPSQRSL